MSRICSLWLLSMIASSSVAGAQTFAFTSNGPLPEGSLLFVSVERAVPQEVKVQFFSDGALFAGDVLFKAGASVATEQTKATRRIEPGRTLEVRYSPSDPKLVPRIGMSARKQPDGTAFNTRIVSVQCDALFCHVCFDLQSGSTVDFDSIPMTSPDPIRNNFANGPRDEGAGQQVDWDQKDDGTRPVPKGSYYFIRLIATSQAYPGGTRSVSDPFVLPANPPSSRSCR